MSANKIREELKEKYCAKLLNIASNPRNKLYDYCQAALDILDGKSWAMPYMLKNLEVKLKTFFPDNIPLIDLVSDSDDDSPPVAETKKTPQQSSRQKHQESLAKYKLKRNVLPPASIYSTPPSNPKNVFEAPPPPKISQQKVFMNEKQMNEKLVKVRKQIREKFSGETQQGYVPDYDDLLEEIPSPKQKKNARQKK